MKKREGSATLYLVIFLVMILAFCAFAVDGTIIFTTRAKLQHATESAALAAASEYQSGTAADVQNTAISTFNMLKSGQLVNAKITVDTTKASDKKVMVTTTCPSPTFFLGVLGVSVVNLNAQAAAKSEALDVAAKTDTVNWVSQAAAYFSNIIASSTDFSDTGIIFPLGKFPSGSYSESLTGSGAYSVAGKKFDINYGLLNNDKSGSALSLGPGGYITVRLPAPVINKPGKDILVEETGVKEGYLIFAGIDKNPQKPYVSHSNPGDGISWVNISCSGSPEFKDSNGSVINADSDTYGYLTKTYTSIANFGTSSDAKAKFYGSGYFDLGSPCLSGGNISVAKYVKIIDDNEENGFVTNTFSDINPLTYYKAHLYGEASTPTAGADIDYIEVLNYVQLITEDEYNS